MTTQGELPATLDDQATAWLVRVRAGDESEADWQGLEAWLSESPAHLDAFERVEALWAELDGHATAIAAGLADDTPAPAEVLAFRPRRVAPARGVRWSPWAAGAGVAAAAAVVAALVLQPAAATTYATGHGETRHLVLNDGTQVDLNAGSKISVAFDGHSRRVVVDDAEATFDVAHDTRRPFLISVGDQQIRVVGTQFNVRRRDAGLTLTVSRGVVEVRPLAGEAPTLRLTAGEQLAHHDGDAASQVRKVSADEAFAWRQHRLICHDCTLAGVAGELTRAFATPVDVAPDARAVTFTGVLVLDDENAVVGRLGAFLPIKADRSEGRIVLSSSR
ncbi:FecR family protein [Caulobacter sp. KR2-114]|uniref:FecR family protein n=1 Tax=Caulobacter sp. KR2-114 TaxID=3400912 RepID=UPI003C02BD0F